MKDQELEILLKKFKVEVQSWGDQELLDSWIAHIDQEEKVPDLHLGKKLIMEGALILRFGTDYRKAVDARRIDASKT